MPCYNREGHADELNRAKSGVTLTVMSNEAPVRAYLAAIADAGLRAQATQLFKVMYEATGAAPQMWGTSIVGFGTLHFSYPASGGGDKTVNVGFAAQQAANRLVLYGLLTYRPNVSRLAQLGPHSTDRGRLYIADMSKIDKQVLAKLVATAYKVRAAQAG